MKRLSATLGVLLVVLGSLPANAADTNVRRLFDVAGLGQWLGQVRIGMIEAFEAAPEIDADAKPRIKALIEQFFPAEALHANAIAALEADMAPEDVVRVTEYLQTGVGRLATQMEVAAQKPGMSERVEREGTRIYRDLLDDGDERAEIYQRVAQSTRAVEFGVTFGMNMSYALISGMMGSPDLPFAMTDDQILALVNSMEPELREQVTAATFAELAFTYRDMEISDLRAYADFLETPAARSFYISQEQALRRFLLPRIQVFGHELMVLLGSRRT